MTLPDNTRGSEYELLFDWKELEQAPPSKKKKIVHDDTLPSDPADEEVEAEYKTAEQEEKNKHEVDRFNQKIEQPSIPCGWDQCDKEVKGYTGLTTHVAEHVEKLSVDQIENMTVKVYKFEWNGEEKTFLSRPSIDSFLLKCILCN